MRDVGPRRRTLVLVTLLAAGVLLSVGFRRDLRADEGEGADAVLEDHECLTCHGFRENDEDAPYVDGHGYLATKHAENGVECTACHENHEDYPHPEGAAALTMNCGECHDEVFEAISQGVHAGLLGDEAEDEDTTAGCVGCHEPHATTGACVDCHEMVEKRHAKSIHGQALAAQKGLPKEEQLAPHCWDCHDHHLVRKKEDPTSPTAVFNIPATCGKCHREGSPVSRSHEFAQENIFRNYSQSLHGAGLFEQGLTVTAVCTSCHTAHDILPHTDPASSVHVDNVADTCRRCHGQIETVHDKVIEGRLWEEEPGRVPACVDCHAPHEQRLKRDVTDDETTRATGVQDGVCWRCHGNAENRDRTLTPDGKPVAPYVDRANFLTAAHHRASPPVTCAQCHSDATPDSSERPCETIAAPVDCAACHAETVTQYRLSTHGTQAAAGDPDAPTCLDCHDKHHTLSHKIPVSPTFARNVPELCGRCHQEGEQAARRIGSDTPVVDSYLMSIHGKGLQSSGLLVTATCVDCHTAHLELPPSDPESSVHDDNIAGTCGSCHFGIEEQFKGSIHWPGREGLEADLPTCKDCHSSHQISRADQADFRLQMTEQCGGCHEHETDTFFKTVHGQSSLLGAARSAKCYDCHGSHAILPPSDPASTLSHKNVVETCSQCHEGAHRKFAGYLTHATHHDPKTYPWLFWTFWAMTTLLIGTLTVALLHTGAWLVRLWLSRDEWRTHKALAHVEPGQKLYRRFDRYQRMQHLFMLLSFFLLAITGMALKFSYMRWAQALADVVGFDAMSTLHRFGALVLVATFIVHLEYVRRKRKRRGLSWKQMLFGPDSMLFSKKDAVEASQSIKWFFGKGPRPRFSRYTYWEKFDYMAVFWGIAVIGFTGLVRWYPEFFTHFMPGWFINVAAIIHSDEALLAVGFIFTIHFFNTHFRPDKFPMDPVIFTGRMTVDELQFDKPAEYEKLVESGELEKRLVDPFPDGVVKSFKVFGFTMLGIGLILIALIVVAMIWGYR